MSFLEDSSVKMESEDQEGDEPQCCSEDLDRSPLEPDMSLTSQSSPYSREETVDPQPIKSGFSQRTQLQEGVMMDQPTGKCGDNPIMTCIRGVPFCGEPYTAVNKPQTGEVSDLNQQVWILQDQTIVTVPRTDSVTPVTVTVVPCKYPEYLEQGRGIPIYMGIENPEMCLSCEDIGGQPTLQLKEEEILDLYNDVAPVEPFLFYHSKDGRTSTFESVAFPGWFIASSEIRHPLFLTSDLGGKNNVNFNLSINA